MDKYEALIMLRNLHYRCFFIGVLFLIAAALIYLPCKCYVANLYQTGFGITAEAYYNMWASFVGLIKTILVFLFLVPGLAIHSMANEYKKKHQAELPKDTI